MHILLLIYTYVCCVYQKAKHRIIYEFMKIRKDNIVKYGCMKVYVVYKKSEVAKVTD